MKISELIQQLQRALDEKGDLPVFLTVDIAYDCYAGPAAEVAVVDQVKIRQLPTEWASAAVNEHRGDALLLTAAEPIE